MIFAISSFFPSSPWQAWSLPQARSWSYAVTPLPSRAGDSVWPVSSSVPVSAVFSVSVVSFRHRSQAKRNGARRRTEEGEKTGGGENSAVARSIPAAARLFPFLSRVRCTIPQDAPASSGTSSYPLRDSFCQQVIVAAGELVVVLELSGENLLAVLSGEIHRV